MSIKGGFFESKLIGGVYDRAYTADEYADRWARFVSNGISVIGGGELSTENQVSIVAGTMTTQVAIGSGYVNGYDYEVDAPEIVTHAAADPTNPRIDRVVIELNLQEATRAFVVKAITGTSAGSPVAPALTRNSEVWQISLAQVLVPANVASLNTATITDERANAAVCGIANVKLGITAPSGNDAITLNVDNSNFQLLSGTNQQVVNNQIDTNLKLSKDRLDEIKYMPNTGTANAIVVSKKGFTLANGNYVEWEQTAANTSNPTINVEGTGSRSLRDTEGVLIPSGDLKIGFYRAIYRSGSNFFVLAPSGGKKTTISASGAILYTESVVVSTLALAPTKLKEFKANYDGTFRVAFELALFAAGGGPYEARARIYKNGVAFGTERSSTSNQTYVSFTQDLVFARNDLIQIYAWVTASPNEARIRLTSFAGDINPAIVTKNL